MNQPKLSTTKNMVLQELQLNPELRADDFKLICAIYEKYVDIDNLTFREVMENHNKFGLPACETIRRSRTTLQAEHPELEPPAEIKALRNARQEDYRELNREEKRVHIQPTAERPTPSGLWGQSILDDIKNKVEQQQKHRPTIGG